MNKEKHLTAEEYMANDFKVPVDKVKKIPSYCITAHRVIELMKGFASLPSSTIEDKEIEAVKLAEKWADEYYTKDSDIVSAVLESDEWLNRKHNYLEGIKIGLSLSNKVVSELPDGYLQGGNFYSNKKDCNPDFKVRPVYFNPQPTPANNVSNEQINKIIELADQRQKSFVRADDEYSNKGNNYRNNERFTWAVSTINRVFTEELRSLFSTGAKQEIKCRCTNEGEASNCSLNCNQIQAEKKQEIIDSNGYNKSGWQNYSNNKKEITEERIGGFDLSKIDDDITGSDKQEKGGENTCVHQWVKYHSHPKIGAMICLKCQSVLA